MFNGMIIATNLQSCNYINYHELRQATSQSSISQVKGHFTNQSQVINSWVGQGETTVSHIRTLSPILLSPSKHHTFINTL